MGVGGSSPLIPTTHKGSRKTIFFVLIILGLTLPLKNFGDDMAFIVPGAFIVLIAIAILLFGSFDKISKLTIKTTRYIQQENKEDLKDIADNTADIYSDAITKATKAVKKGTKETMFCKFCGAEIDFDSKFCNRCGKEQ